MPKLTKREVDRLRPGDKEQVIFDDQLGGFGLRVKPSGAKSWLIQYRNAHGRSRRLTIGTTSKVAPEQARVQAKKLFGAIADGADPAETRAAIRKTITVAQLCDEYLKTAKISGRRGHPVKASTLAMDRSRIERHVKPLLGARKVVSLTPADMEKFLRDVMAGKTATPPAKGKSKGARARGGRTTGGVGAASRTLGMLGTILEYAVRDGALQRNPARGVVLPKTTATKPPFSFDLVASLGAALREAADAQESEVGIRAIQFLLLSGCRRMEALTLRWGVVDWNDHCLRLSDSKSGAQVRPLGTAALALLDGFRPSTAKASDFVFPGAIKSAHLVGLPRIWTRMCARAKIEGVSIHGLRHWFASAATALGYSELIIAGLLGHSVKGVTARYATAPDSSLIAAADAVAQALADKLKKRAA